MAHYIVTLYTPENSTKTTVPFPTAKIAAYAALLIYRVNAEQPTAMGVHHFLITKGVARLSWSNALRTIHIDIEKF